MQNIWLDEERKKLSRTHTASEMCVRYNLSIWKFPFSPIHKNGMHCMPSVGINTFVVSWEHISSGFSFSSHFLCPFLSFSLLLSNCSTGKPNAETTNYFTEAVVVQCSAFTFSTVDKDHDNNSNSNYNYNYHDDVVDILTYYYCIFLFAT